MGKVYVGGKTSDMAHVTLEIDGEEVEHDGYMPTGIPALGGGDYIEIVIDNETGVVEGWVPLKFSDLSDDDEEDED